MRLPEPLLGGEHPINRLREAHAALEAACHALPAPARDHVAWLLDGLSDYDGRAAAGLTLDAALGLRRRSGPDQWWRRERLANRDRIIRDVRTRFYPDLDEWAAASAILCDAATLEKPGDPPPGSAAAELARAVRYERIPGKQALHDILVVTVK